VIIIVNFLLFIATIISSDVIIRLGLVPAAFLDRPWTIVTNMFVHAGFWHFFGNMITLFFFGRFLSMLVGENRFLLVYFIGGILGNIFYLLLALYTPLGEPLSIAIGASGAVYAVAGALVMLRPKVRVMLYFFIPMPLWVVVLVFFVIWSFIPGFNIAWQAHLGGLLAGLIAGYFFRRRERSYYFR
jgi:membrane associated rhomboid family serine protease